MKKSTILNLVKYGVGAIAVLAFAGIYLWQKDFLGLTQLSDRYMVLSDAFTIPGMMLIMFGAMVWLTGQGALDGVTFCLRYAVYALIPGKRSERAETYAEYVEKKSEKRNKAHGFFLWIGLVTFIVGLVFFILYGFSTDWAWFAQLQS